MERHPIPKNIMDVEFKLFGSLTLKQFFSLFACFVFALFIYLMNLPPVVGWPLIGFFAFMGFSLAFITVQGQSFGVWFMNFVIAMVTPQRKVWRKSNRIPKALTQSYDVPKVVKTKDKAEIIENIFLRLEDQETSKKINDYESTILGNIDRYMAPVSQAPVLGYGTNPYEQMHSGTLAQNYNSPVQPKPANVTQQHARIDIENLSSSLPMNTGNVVTNTSQVTPIPVQANSFSTQNFTATVSNPNVSITPSEMEMQSNPVVAEYLNSPTNVPVNFNTISGEVYDNLGNPFVGAVITIADAKGNPVRQVSTNLYGRFALTNPLPVGKYFIEAGNSTRTAKFDTMEIVIDGKQQVPILKFKQI